MFCLLALFQNLILRRGIPVAEEGRSICSYCAPVAMFSAGVPLHLALIGKMRDKITMQIYDFNFRQVEKIQKCS